MTAVEALALLMDQVDYASGNCRVNDMVGAAVAPEVLNHCRNVLAEVRARSAHLSWCRRRALEYVDHNDLPNAAVSMLSDLGKHPGTRGAVEGPVGMALIMLAGAGDSHAVRKWIENVQ